MSSRISPPRSLITKDTIGTQLRKAREGKGLTQEQLAEILGVSASQISKWEHDYTLPKSLEDREHINKVLGVSITNEIPHFKGLSRTIKQFVNLCPNFFRLLENTATLMPDDQFKASFLRMERRLGEFDEKDDLLAMNCSLYLAGELSLDDKPKNGLRPLRHYITPWSAEIEEW